MRIGIDYRPALLGTTGVGRYVRELVAGMAPLLRRGEELVLFGASLAPVDRSLANPVPSPAPGAGKVTLKRNRMPGRLLQMAGRLGLATVESFTGPLDLFFYTDLTFPPLRAAPHCLMVHDLAYLESDRFHGVRFGQKAWKRLYPVVEKAEAVVVPSEATARALEPLLPHTGKRGRPAPIRVVPHGFDHLLPLAEGEPRPDRGARYFLVVGTLEPRKNQEKVVQAFEKVLRFHGETELLIAGKPGWLFEPLLEACAQPHVKEKVKLLGAVGDSELVRLYRGAIGLVYPSLSEGFGLPVAEALSLGCPVITSNRSSLPEVAGEAAILVDPDDVAAIAAAMNSLVRDRGLGEELSRRGIERARERTWSAAAASTLDLFREVVSPSSNRSGSDGS